MTAWEFIRNLHSVCHFQTREGKKVGKASSSEEVREHGRAYVVEAGKDGG